MGKQFWSQAVLESGSWGYSILQTPALVYLFIYLFIYHKPHFLSNDSNVCCSSKYNNLFTGILLKKYE